MYHWIPYAFVRIVVFFIAGILLAIYFPTVVTLQVGIWFLCAFAFAYFVVYFLKLKNDSKIISSGVIGLMTIFIAGFVNTVVHTQTNHEDHLIDVKQPIDAYECVMNKYAEEKERSWKFEAELITVKTGTEWQQVSGKILLYIAKTENEKPFQYGDRLLIKGSPRQVSPPANPYGFDFKKFLSYNNIFHQHFAHRDDVVFIEHEPESKILEMAFATRVWCDNVLEKFVKGPQEQAIASALVLGVTDGLDDDLLHAYAATGAMHVLAVSGLHVGIIYMLLMILLKPIKRIPHGNILVAFVCLMCLWMYAFITGLSPSVLRAVTMFSFVAIGQAFRQRTNIFNTLAASAFLLLMFNPFFLMSVGFQLSYLAVIGIVYLQPHLYRLWEPKSRILDEVWKISGVSIAAQAATFSLGLFYFHQFPNYFLLSNLAVIPGSFCILVLGLLLVAISFIEPIATLGGILLEYIIKAMNAVVFFIDSLPFSLLGKIYISAAQCLILLITVVFVVIFIQLKKTSFLYAAFLLTVTFTILQWWDYREQFEAKSLAVYNLQGHTAFDLIEQGNVYAYTDDVLSEDANMISFHIEPTRLHAKADVVHDLSAVSKRIPGASLISWNDKLILHIYSKDFHLKKVDVDYVIISNNAVADVESLLAQIHASQIILDSSNSIYYTNSVLKQNETSVPVHSVLLHGFFIKTISV